MKSYAPEITAEVQGLELQNSVPSIDHEAGAFTKLVHLAGWAAGLATLLLVALVSYDVFVRFCFNAPTDWSVEISGYLLVAIVFLGSAYTSMTGGHIRVELIEKLLSPTAKKQIDAITSWLVTVFIANLAWLSIVQVIESYLGGRRQFSILQTLTYLPQSVIALGLVVFFLQLVGTSALREGLSRGRSYVVMIASIVCLITLGVLTITEAPMITSALFLACVLFVMMAFVSGFKTTLSVSGLVGLFSAMFMFSQGVASPGMVMAEIGLMLIGLLLIGVPVAMSLGFVGLIGVFFLIPGFRPIALAERAWTVTNSFEMAAVPAFLLMGELLLASGLANDLYQNVGKWIGRVRGGFAHASMVACAIFAAVSGSSVATAVTIGTVAAPEMIQRGFSPRLTYGSLAAGGTLGILIPPSIIMLIYGSMMGVSIGDLFIAGVIPGLLLVGMFMLTILIWSVVQPSATPAGPIFSLREKMAGLRHMMPVIGVMVLVLGGMYGGVFTPSEAGVVGAAASALLCIWTRKFNYELIRNALLATVRTTSFILMIVVGAACMSYVLDYLGVAATIAESVKGLGLAPWMVMVIIFIGYLILGALMDGTSMMVVTLPVVFPIVVSLGYDPVWFGVVMVVLIEAGLIHPPVGMNIFVIYGVAKRISKNISLTDISMGAVPFLLQMFLLLALLLVFPEIATWLPLQMRN